jgi:hypothetical protein
MKYIFTGVEKRLGELILVLKLVKAHRVNKFCCLKRKAHLILTVPK